MSDKQQPSRRIWVLLGVILVVCVALTPLKNAFLQSDFNANSFAITNAANVSSEIFTLNGVPISSWPSGLFNGWAVPDGGTLRSNANQGSWSVYEGGNTNNAINETNVQLNAIVPGSVVTGLILSNSVVGGVATLVLVPSPVGSGGGGVSSVSGAGDGTLFPSGIYGTVTSSGTLTLPALQNQSANTIFAGPISGSAATPTIRALNQQDLPPIAITNHNATAPTFSGLNLTALEQNAGMISTSNALYTILGLTNSALIAEITAATNTIAANSLTGTIATARLGSGTANAGTALIGSQAWAVMTNLLAGDSAVVISGGVIDVSAALQALSGGNGSALSSLTAANISAGTAGINISGNATTATTATSFSGALSGNVTGTQSATVVSSVGSASLPASQLTGTVPTGNLASILQNIINNWTVGSGGALTGASIDASEINSGTIGTARLGSGTANSGTYLGGDQSWDPFSNITNGTDAAWRAALGLTNTAILATLATSSNQYIANGTTTSNWATANFQPLATILTTFSGLANATGNLHNNGSGVFSWASGGSGTVTQWNPDAAGVVASVANATTTPTPTFSVASPSQLGVVKNDGNSIAVSPAGVISESNYDVWPSGGFTNIEGTTTNICFPGVTYVITPITTNAIGATGTTNFFAGNTNVVVSQSGVAVNGGTVQGAVVNTNAPQINYGSGWSLINSGWSNLITIQPGGCFSETICLSNQFYGFGSNWFFYTNDFLKTHNGHFMVTGKMHYYCPTNGTYEGSQTSYCSGYGQTNFPTGVSTPFVDLNTAGFPGRNTGNAQISINSGANSDGTVFYYLIGPVTRGTNLICNVTLTVDEFQ